MPGQDQQKTQVLFDSQSSYSSSVTPSTSLFSVDSVDISPDETVVRDRGLGEGKDPVNHIKASYQETGSIEFKPVSFDFFQHLYGPKTGNGTSNDPFVISAADTIGFNSSDLIPATVLEQNLTSGEKTQLAHVGVVGQNFSISANQGELIQVSANVHALKNTDSVAEQSFGSRSKTPYQMIGGTVEFGDPLEDAGLVRQASINVDLGLNVNSSRPNDSLLLGEPPTIGERTHEFSLQVVYNQAVKTLFRNALRGASDSIQSDSSDPEKGEGVDFKIVASRGSSSQAVIYLQDCSVDEVTKPVSIGGGNVVSTVSGQALQAKGDDLIRWY